MLKDSNIGAIDLDHCVDKESTKLESWAEQLSDEANGAYQEITVSGGGLRIIGTVTRTRDAPQVHLRPHDRRRHRALPQHGALHHDQRPARSASPAPSCRRSTP